VIVICQGNICRSPFGERHLAAQCPHLDVRSAGLKARDGDPVQPAALRIGSEFGVDLEDHAAHLLRDVDVEWADLILGMQGWHQASVHRQWPNASAKVRLLGDFLTNAPHTVEDPWGAPDDFFRAVFEQISLANARLSRLLASSERPGL
jgi:protein-tyrosine phosphatase